jgi:hypothetical protein
MEKTASMLAAAIAVNCSCKYSRVVHVVAGFSCYSGGIECL